MIKKIFLIFLSIGFSLYPETVPRTVITFYDSALVKDLYLSRSHQLAEMPCNHEGLVFNYYDIHGPLPDIEGREDVLGVLIWFDDDTKLEHDQGLALFHWALKALDRGKKFLVMGSAIFQPDIINLPVNTLNQFWEKLGMRITGSWVDETFNVTLHRVDPEMMDFERELPSVLPDYLEVIPVSNEVTCYLIATAKKQEYPDTCLVASSKNGGYVAGGYEAYYLYEKGKVTRKWYINPFSFFRNVFGTEKMPKPDTTTIAGRRIYYSHVDGDGWNNQTELGTYPFGSISAEVLYDYIYLKYPQLPVTVSPIGAEVDPTWVALKYSQKIAKKIFALPNVEMGSHTFTHPFDWGFFENYLPSDEVPYLHLYPSGSWLGRGFLVRIRSLFEKSTYVKDDDTIEDEEVLGEIKRVKTFDEFYDVPRAYALKPFNLDLEVSGSIQLINTLGPDDKKVALYQWSGDCRPFFKAIKSVVDSGLLNINGGDTRFDNVYSSYAWVAPLGRQVDALWQVYASNSNENLYNNLWRSNFFGFNLLPQTFENTERPIRVKPMNLYYHIYSGQKNSSLKALEQNIEYVETQEIAPIKASEFASIGQGFYSTEITKEGNNQWRFCCRQGLQTIRFDRASFETVDLSKSVGVVGFRHHQGSLYVYLDSHYEEDAIIALKTHNQYHKPPVESTFYLINSRWQVYDVKKEGREKITYQTVGFGPGEMSWNVPSDGSYLVRSSLNHNLLVEAVDRQLNFTIHGMIGDPITIQISKSSL